MQHKSWHIRIYRCLAYSYQETLVPVYLATLRVFRVFRPMRAIRISAFYVRTHVLCAYHVICAPNSRWHMYAFYVPVNCVEKAFVCFRNSVIHQE